MWDEFCGYIAAQDVLATPVVQVRDRIVGQCVTILYTYRKFCATASSSGQLILPEALKLLPLYTMGIHTMLPHCFLASLIVTMILDNGFLSCYLLSFYRSNTESSGLNLIRTRKCLANLLSNFCFFEIDISVEQVLLF